MTSPNPTGGMSRRTMLKLGTCLALTAHTPAEAATDGPAIIDTALARATASERAWYHAVALAEAMGEIDPSRYYIARVEPHEFHAIVWGLSVEVQS